MKTSKKITIAALSAATALVGATGAVSSFAWFATNSHVTADGMTIKAESTNEFLEIKKAADTWDNAKSNTSATFETEPKTLKPTSLVKEFNTTTVEQYADNGKSHAWVNATSNDVANGKKNGEYVDVTKLAETVGTSNQYTLIADFDLRLRYTASMGEPEQYNLSAVVYWANGASDNLSKTVEVFMIVGNEGTESITVGGESSGLVFSADDDNNNHGWSAQRF